MVDLRARSLRKIDAIAERLQELTSEFRFPPRVDFVDGQSQTISVDIPALSVRNLDNEAESPLDPPNYAFTPTNVPIHEYKERLTKLLFELDAVESGGAADVREKRKEVVKQVHEVVEWVERGWRNRAWAVYQRDLQDQHKSAAQERTYALSRHQTSGWVDGEGSSASFYYAPIQVHACLGHHPTMLPIEFDLSLPPIADFIRLNTELLHTTCTPLQILEAPATHPPLSLLTLLCDSLPWRITAAPASVVMNRSEPGPVKVSDILKSIYESLRFPASPAELDTLDDTRYELVEAAYRTRCNRHHSRRDREAEHKAGIRRIDFLMGKHQFGGLVATVQGPDMWALQIF